MLISCAGLHDLSHPRKPKFCRENAAWSTFKSLSGQILKKAHQKVLKWKLNIWTVEAGNPGPSGIASTTHGAEHPAQYLGQVHSCGKNKLNSFLISEIRQSYNPYTVSVDVSTNYTQSCIQAGFAPHPQASIKYQVLIGPFFGAPQQKKTSYTGWFLHFWINGLKGTQYSIVIII